MTYPAPISLAPTFPRHCVYALRDRSGSCPRVLDVVNRRVSLDAISSVSRAVLAASRIRSLAPAHASAYQP